MEPLKVEKKEYYTIGYRDLQDFLRKVFDTNKIECVPYGCQNDSYLTMHVLAADGPPEEWDEYDKEALEDFVGGDSGYGTWGIEAALSEACRQGLCPEGDYLLSISW